MKPILQALVLAERIYEDKSGKKIIAGTFNALIIAKVQPVAHELPDGSRRHLLPGGTDPGCPSVYISMTDVVDGTEITLQFVNVSKNERVVATGFKISSSNRLATYEIIAPLPPISALVKEPGTYSLDVVWNGEILGSHRVIAKEPSGPSA